MISGNGTIKALEKFKLLSKIEKNDINFIFEFFEIFQSFVESFQSLENDIELLFRSLEISNLFQLIYLLISQNDISKNHKELYFSIFENLLDSRKIEEIFQNAKFFSDIPSPFEEKFIILRMLIILFILIFFSNIRKK